MCGCTGELSHLIPGDLRSGIMPYVNGLRSVKIKKTKSDPLFLHSVFCPPMAC